MIKFPFKSFQFVTTDEVGNVNSFTDALNRTDCSASDDYFDFVDQLNRGEIPVYDIESFSLSDVFNLSAIGVLLPVSQNAPLPVRKDVPLSVNTDKQQRTEETEIWQKLYDEKIVECYKLKLTMAELQRKVDDYQEIILSNALVDVFNDTPQNRKRKSK